MSLCLLGDVMLARLVTLAITGDKSARTRGLQAEQRKALDRIERDMHFKRMRAWHAGEGDKAGNGIFSEDLWEAMMSCECVLCNFEGAVSDRPFEGDRWNQKHRVHPDCVRAAFGHGGSWCCSLANNHILDDGLSGGKATVDILRSLRVAHAGYGECANQASEPAILSIHVDGVSHSVAVLSYADHFAEWACDEGRPGINYFDFAGCALERGAGGNPNRWRTHFLDRMRRDIAECLVSRGCSMVVVSVHWGDNFVDGDVPESFRSVARELISAGATIVHGHSAHHILGVEIVRCRRRIADPSQQHTGPGDYPPSESSESSGDELDSEERGEADAALSGGIHAHSGSHTDKGGQHQRRRRRYDSGDASDLEGDIVDQGATGLVLYGLGGAIDDYGAAARLMPDADSFAPFAEHRSGIGMACVVQLQHEGGVVSSAHPASRTLVLASATLIALKISDECTTSVAKGDDADWFESRVQDMSADRVTIERGAKEGYFNVVL
eukprot:Opistho-2@84156